MAGNPEATAITDAYADEVKTLYKVLVNNMIGNDPSAVKKFTSGLDVARQARDAALRAAGAQVTALATKNKSKAK